LSELHRRQVFRNLAIAEPLTPALMALLLAFAVVFVLQMVVPPFQAFALDCLALDTHAFLGRLHLWQAVTSMFLHGSVCHFLSNMVFLWFFGSLLANAWRAREFLVYFFTCGIVASLCFFAFNALRTPAAVKGLGASGAVMGLMIACAMVYGDRVVFAFFMIPMKLKYFVAIALAVDVLAVCATVQDGVGHAAHLGGAICGVVYLKAMRRRQNRLAGVTTGRAAAGSRMGGIEVMDDDAE
jgi:membrane associated rhomboid family serine protease